MKPDTTGNGSSFRNGRRIRKSIEKLLPDGHILLNVYSTKHFTYVLFAPYFGAWDIPKTAEYTPRDGLLDIQTYSCYSDAAEGYNARCMGL